MVLTRPLGIVPVLPGLPVKQHYVIRNVSLCWMNMRNTHQEVVGHHPLAVSCDLSVAQRAGKPALLGCLPCGMVIQTGGTEGVQTGQLYRLCQELVAQRALGMFYKGGSIDHS